MPFNLASDAFLSRNLTPLYLSFSAYWRALATNSSAYLQFALADAQALVIAFNQQRTAAK
jgi:hypothetical protein